MSHFFFESNLHEIVGWFLQFYLTDAMVQSNAMVQSKAGKCSPKCGNLPTSLKVNSQVLGGMEGCLDLLLFATDCLDIT